jgi:hypothetical protein
LADRHRHVAEKEVELYESLKANAFRLFFMGDGIRGSGVSVLRIAAQCIAVELCRWKMYIGKNTALLQPVISAECTLPRIAWGHQWLQRAIF